MSVINQVLLELEKRRVSGAERASLPDHVRALPDNDTGSNPLWLVAAAAAALALAVLAWIALSGAGPFRRPAADPGTGRSGGDTAIERVAAASAAVITDAVPGGDAGERGAGESQLAGRLSFELARAPAAPRADRAAPELNAEGEPISTARVLSAAEQPVAKTGAAPAAASAPAPAAPAVAATPARAQRAPAGAPAAAAVEKTAESAAAGIDKQVRQPTARELSDNEYRKAAASLHQGRQQEAMEGFRAALNLFSGHHGARQALAAVLIESKQHAEAERLLQEGTKLAPEQVAFAMTLARLQVDRGDLAAAVATLQAGLAHAQANPDYAAFLAALLQRQGRHEDAIAQFQTALRAKPATGVWWLGLAVSQQAVNRVAEAQEAYRRARASNNLSPELVAFAEQRLRQLQ